MRNNVVKEKSFLFALEIVKVSKYLQEAQREFVLSKQILRSGTAIGALVRESEYAESRADFAHKLAIALKESNETLYWLDLLHQSSYITLEMYEPLRSYNEELMRLLIAIVKSSRSA